MRNNLKWIVTAGLLAGAAVFIIWLLNREDDGPPKNRKSGQRFDQDQNRVSPGAGEPLLPSIRAEDAEFEVSFAQLVEQSPFKGSDLLVDGRNGPGLWPSTARALMLSEAQAHSINKVLTSTLGEIRKLEREHLAVVRQTNTELELRVDAFPEAGAAVLKRVEHEISGIAGRTGEALVEILRASLLARYRNFGARERKIIGKVTDSGYNEVIEDGVTRGFPFSMSFDSMQQHLFSFEVDK